MDSLILITIVLFWLTIVLGLGNVFLYVKQKEVLTHHIHEIAVDSTFLKQPKKSFLDRVITYLSKYADDLSAIGERINFSSESSDVEALLKKAGNPYEMTVARFQGFKIVCVLLGLIIGIFMVVIGLPLANVAFAILPFIGFFIPIILVRMKAKKRQEQLRKDLPDFLDTVSISLQAGASLDSAINEVIKYFTGPIQEEFSKYIQEIDLGVPRDKAYKGLLDRNDNEEFQSLIKSLIQATRLGVPIAEPIKAQAEDIRKITLEQVKEKAAKASPKVTLITSFLIAPLIMLLIIGIVILNMIYGENSVFTFFSSY